MLAFRRPLTRWSRLSHRALPRGWPFRRVACGETVYDGQAKRMKRPAQVVCQAYLYAAAQPGGLFTDFELRGGIKP